MLKKMVIEHLLKVLEDANQHFYVATVNAAGDRKHAVDACSKELFEVKRWLQALKAELEE